MMARVGLVVVLPICFVNPGNKEVLYKGFDKISSEMYRSMGGSYGWGSNLLLFLVRWYELGRANIQIKGNYRVVFYNSVFQTWNFLSFSFGKTVSKHGILNINFQLSSGAIVNMWSCLVMPPLTFKEDHAGQLIPIYQLPAIKSYCCPHTAGKTSKAFVREWYSPCSATFLVAFPFPRLLALKRCSIPHPAWRSIPSIPPLTAPWCYNRP